MPNTSGSQISLNTELAQQKINELALVEKTLQNLQKNGADSYGISNLNFKNDKNTSKGPMANKMLEFTTELSKTLQLAETLVHTTKEYLIAQKDLVIEADQAGG